MPYRPYPNADRALRRVTRGPLSADRLTHYRALGQRPFGEAVYVPACGSTGGRLSLTGLMVDCPDCLS